MAPQRREGRKGRTRTEGWCAATAVRVKQHVVAAHDAASPADPVDPVHPGILSKSSRREAAQRRSLAASPRRPFHPRAMLLQLLNNFAPWRHEIFTIRRQNRAGRRVSQIEVKPVNNRNVALMLVALLSLAALSACFGCAAGSSSKAAGDDDESPAGDDDASPNDDDNDASPSADDDSFTCDVTHPHSTVGLISCQPGAYGGYTLLAPTMANTVYLINMFGHVINTWPGKYLPGQVVYLLENGQLLRTGNGINLNFASGGQGGIVQLQDWDGTVTWSFTESDSEKCLHHDVHMMPNGNILVIGWEKKTQAESVAAGRDPTTIVNGQMWSDYYLELTPVGTSDADVVWEWHMWDHLIQDYDSSQANYGVVGDHPELIDINNGAQNAQDWMHTNSIDYNAAYDQVLVSVRNISEIWILDHSTTTAEAASHSGGARGRGGDLLYRWGNPSAYRQDAAPRDFYGQHDGQWIADGLPGAGHMLAYNNGVGRPEGKYSTIDEFAPAVNADGSYPAPDPVYGPADLTWSFTDTPPTAMFSNDMSGAQRLADGNTLICIGDSGVFLEVTAAGKIVWQYVNPVTETGIMQQGQTIPPGVGGAGNEAFRAFRYQADYAGLAGRDLTPGNCLVEPCE
jgi:hypothetical protein